MKLQIGTITIPNNLILAPMAGITDLTFRLLCREQGCGMTVTEMVSAKALLYENKNTESLMQITSEDRPVSVQLFGSEPDTISEMAKKIEERDIDIIDINMGCPVPKIVNNGEGSALMRQPKLVEKIVTQTVKAVKKPVTVKIRKGFNENEINAKEIAYIIQESGAAAIALHGRTREQYYSGKADWDIIGDVKQKLTIPVIGNGDIFTAEDAVKMMQHTQCDGIMVARGAKGNPWIFNEILTYIETGSKPLKPTYKQMIDMILRQAEMTITHKGEFTAIREMRKHVAWYVGGYPYGAKLRAEVNKISTYNALEQLLFDFASKIKE